MSTKIPASTIGVLSQILPNHYTHTEINGLFLAASAPEEIPEGSKSAKVTAWLRAINAQCPEPLKVLGIILKDFIEKPKPDDGYYAGKCFDRNEEAIAAYQAERQKIIRSLVNCGLQYSQGGYITRGGAAPTLSLQENVTKRGLTAVDIEIKRALENVESDPLAAVHNAGSVLEAALKAYLDHHKVEYKEDTDTLSDLWQKVVGHIGIHPKDWTIRTSKK